MTGSDELNDAMNTLKGVVKQWKPGKRKTMNINKTSLIVEGLDCAGKSTIIRHIMSKIETLNYYHYEFPIGNNAAEKYGFQHGQFDMMFKFIEMTQGQSHFIFDRAHIGEYIWGPKYRQLFPTYMPELEDKYKHLPIVLVRVYCDPELTYKRFEERTNEKTPDIDYIKKYTKQFELYCNRSPFRCIGLDTTNLTDPVMISTAVDHLITTIKEEI